MLKQILVLAGILAAVMVISTPIYTSALTPQSARQQQTTGNTFEYAQLTRENGNYVFDTGGNFVPPTRSSQALQRELGSSAPGRFVNLLDAIGSQGWELVQGGSGSTWIFKRRAN